MPRNLVIIPKAVQRQLIRGYQHSAETGESAPDALLHYFNPYGAGDWYISEACPIDAAGDPCPDNPERADDWHMFGFCNLGDARFAELGYVMLSDLQGLRVSMGRYQFPIEREIRWTPRPLADIQQQTREAC
jgi:hypothetical protein